jgi:hypothetical protein
MFDKMVNKNAEAVLEKVTTRHFNWMMAVRIRLGEH